MKESGTRRGDVCLPKPAPAKPEDRVAPTDTDVPGKPWQRRAGQGRAV